MSPLAKIACQTIEEVGGNVDLLAHGGKHLRLYWSRGDCKFIETLAVSPSCWRVERKVRAPI